MRDPDVVPAAEMDPAEVFRVHQRRRLRRRIIRWTLAGLNLVLGIVGLFLPIIQGVLHLVIAVALVAPDMPAARRLTVWLLRRLPRVRRMLPRAIRRLTRKDGA